MQTADIVPARLACLAARAKLPISVIVPVPAPSVAGDLRVGSTVMCFEGSQVNDAYGPSRSKNDGGTGLSYMGRITDTSDLFKSIVRIIPSNRHTSALRVAR